MSLWGLEQHMQMSAFRVREDHSVVSIDPREMTSDWFTDDSVYWVDVLTPTADDVRQFLEPLGLHHSIAAACIDASDAPCVIMLERYLYMVCPFSGPHNQISWLRFLCGPTAIVSLHADSIPKIGELASDLQEDLRLVQPNVGALLYEILHTAMGAMVPTYLQLRDDVEVAAEDLELATRESSADDIRALKTRATKLSNAYEDHLFCIRELGTAKSEAMPLRTVRRQFQELLAELARGRDMTIRLEDRVRDLRQAHANMMQEAMNRRLNVLAVLSMIYLPATLIAGIYGMNFTDIPIQQTPYGYLLVMILMLVVVVGQMLFFWKRGWFK